MSDIGTTARLAELRGLQAKLLALWEEEERLKKREDEIISQKIQIERVLWNKLADLSGVNDGQLEDGEPGPSFTLCRSQVE